MAMTIYTVLTFNILLWNARGIMSSALTLSEALNVYCCDVALITEHKLFFSSLNFLDSINDCYFSHAVADNSIDPYSRARCGKGGVAIMYKKCLRIQPIENEIIRNCCRIAGIEINLENTGRLFVFCIYMPSDNDIKDYKLTLEQIQDLIDIYTEMGHVVLAGDFNAQIYSNSSVTKGNKRKSNLLKLFMTENHLNSATNSENMKGPQYTFIPNQTMLDHIFLDRAISSRVTECEIFDKDSFYATSDHLLVFCNIGLPTTCASKKCGLGNKGIAWHKCK